MSAKLLVVGSVMAGLFATSANADMIYNVSSTSVTNCSGAPHGLWTNNDVGGGSCSNYFDIQSGTQFTVFNNDPDQNNWTATLTGTALNPQSKTATLDILLSGFQETSTHYKQEGGGNYNPVTDNPDLDFFTDISGTIDIDGTVYDISNFVGDYTFQYGLGANAKSPTEYGGSAWFQGDFNSHHWDLNLTFAKVPEPSSMALLGLGLLSLAGMRKRAA